MDTSTPTTPYATVADIIRKQNEIERRLSAVEHAHRDIADAFDTLSGGISDLGLDPLNARAIKACLQYIAAILREGVRHG